MLLLEIGVLMIAVALVVTFLISAANKSGLVDRAAALAARGETAESRHLLQRLVTS
jgi:hypothetical protein